jgi:hypothetical protein
MHLLRIGYFSIYSFADGYLASPGDGMGGFPFFSF